MNKIVQSDIDTLFKKGEELLMTHYHLTNDSGFTFKLKMFEMEIRFEINDYESFKSMMQHKQGSTPTKTWELEIYSDIEKNPIGFRLTRRYTEEDIKRLIFRQNMGDTLSEDKK